MTDDEMRAMPIPALQDEGMLFLWVTGRAMEVGRECLRVWGYTRVDEVVWVKTNQVSISRLPVFMSTLLTINIYTLSAPTRDPHRPHRSLA
jgi:hypothetical protein